jgi:hypothetical protein
MAVAGLSLSCVVSAGHAQAPLPLDPLTERERTMAESIARADSRVRELLASGRPQLISIDFIAAKTPGDGSPDVDVPVHRHAEVLFHLSDRNVGVSVLVDLERRQVVDVARGPGDAVPISSAEVERAARLALADARVVSLFAGRLPAFHFERRPDRPDTAATRIDAIRTLGARGDPCFGRRCVVLFFRVDNQYLHMNRILVDLLSDRVIVREEVQR